MSKQGTRSGEKGASSYRLFRMNGGNEKYGACSCCGNHVDTMYHLIRYRNAIAASGKLVLIESSSSFGHKGCMSQLTHEP